MKAVTLGVVAAAALFAACFVERPSKAYECQTTADCAGFDDNRACVSGYCVVSSCPRDCTSCDESAQTCMVECSSANSCGSVTCPAGWDCTINCIGGNACNDVDCVSGSRCAINCVGADACETVSCSLACKCDLNCVAGACNTPDCPTAGNGANRVECTNDGTDTGMCDSAHASGCTKC